MQEVEQLKAGSTGTGDIVALGIVTVPIGTNYSFQGQATDGNRGGSSSGMANVTTSYVLTENRNNVGMWASTYGSANGYAWTGQRFDVSGSGSRSAYVNFRGFHRSYVLGSFGGTAHIKLSVRVFDATTSSVIADQVVFDETSNFNVIKSNSFNYNNSVLVSLTAGHQYVAYVFTEGDVLDTSGSGMNSQVESGDSTRYTNWNTIAITWQ